MVGEPAISAPPPPNLMVKGKMRVAPSLPLDTVAPCTIKMGEVMPVPHSIPAGLDPERMITGDTVVMEQPELLMTGQMMVRQVPTYYYIDGVKIEARESMGLPASTIEEVQVITGGLPGTFGDIDGGITFPPEDPACTDTVEQRGLPLTGRVVDATTGTVLRGATVTWVETDLRCCTDANGLFGFPVEPSAQHGTVTLRIEATGHAPQERPVPTERLPLCMPIALPRSTEPTESRTSKAIDMWNVPMQAQERPMFMGLVVTRKPTLWERVKSPFRR
jgi:hypothetical protein